jgi:hypothetical protein
MDLPGFEPGTSSLSATRSNQLSYRSDSESGDSIAFTFHFKNKIEINLTPKSHPRESLIPFLTRKTPKFKVPFKLS